MDEERSKERQARVQRPAVFVGDRAAKVNALLAGLPAFEGEPIRLEWGRQLRISRGLLHRDSGPGTEVHAAAFPRKRLLVLETALLRNRTELARITVHELFHFVWVRLGNDQRREWGRVLAVQRAAGELGWSSEWRKAALLPDGFGVAGRRWSEYVCESFCDTAAWLYSAVNRHEEFTLGRAQRAMRKDWFHALLRHRGGRFRI